MAQNSLKDLGWYLNLHAIPELNPGAPINDIVKRALDLDLRQIADPKSIDTKGKTSICGPIVLQLQKTLNIAVPKDQSETSIQGNSKRLLLLTLTDGSASYQAVEIQPIRGLSMDTPPGTKIRLTGEISVWKGFLQLFPGNTDVLGGNVSKLAQAWELSRQLGSRAAAMLKSQSQRQQTGPGGHGPPAFVPFGQRIANKYDAASTDNFKAMDVISKDKTQGSGATEDADEVDEFSEQRQAAIAKALAKQKQKPSSDEKSLPMPDISQLSIATKPVSAPPRPAPVVAPVSTGPDGDDRPRGRFGGGRGRRGRAGYEDDYETMAAMGRPSQFSLFDVIQGTGQEKLKLVAETAKLVAESERPSTSGYGGNSSARGGGGRYDDQGGRGGRGGYRGGGGRGNWRGRGGSGSRTSYPSSRGGGQGVPPPLFREGSAASSRGLDSASPTTSEGGRGGTGNRDLPPRLKRHHQSSISQNWAEEAAVDGMYASQQKGRTSTGYDLEGDDSNGNGRSRQQSQSQQPSTSLLPTPAAGQASLQAMYQPVVTADGTTYQANAEALMAYGHAAFPGASYAIQQPIITSQFVPSSVASPPPVVSSSVTNNQTQASQSSSSQASNAVVSSGVDWRPGTYCFARWNDGGFYPAQIISVDPQAQTAIVNYYQYSELQNVPLSALHPLPIDGAGPTALQPAQQVLLTMLPPPQAMQPGGADLLRHQQQQQQRMMWMSNGSPLLPPPPPFPGIESFANRLSLAGMPPVDSVVMPIVPTMPPSIPIAQMGSYSASSTKEKDHSTGSNSVKEQPASSEASEKAVEQPSNDSVQLETAVAAG